MKQKIQASTSNDELEDKRIHMNSWFRDEKFRWYASCLLK